MVEPVKKFKISFRSLLADMTRELGWPAPMYGCKDLGSKTAFVVLRYGYFSASHCFVGDSCETIEESEERVARDAVYQLALIERIRIDDVNCLVKEKYEKCVEYFTTKTADLEQLHGVLGRIEEGVVDKEIITYSRVMSIDYESLLVDVLDHFEMDRTQTHHEEVIEGSYVASFAIFHLGCDHLIDWLIGEPCTSKILATQNAAKKAVLYVSTFRHFEVEDANYREMKLARSILETQQDNYRLTKARLSDGCTTPRGQSSRIPNSAVPPPAPKKPKYKAVDTGSMSGRATLCVQVPKDLTKVFKRKERL